MKIFRTILDNLAIPDDQGDNWYNWAGNQLTHVLLGNVLVGGLWLKHIPYEWQITILVALSKEIFDFLKNPTFRTLRDNLHDLAFSCLGVLIGLAMVEHFPAWFFLSCIAVCAVLLSGVVSRIKSNNKE